MKNIAMLLYDYSCYGGAEKVAIKLANELSEVYNVTLISCFNTNDKIIFSTNELVRTYVLSQEVESLSLKFRKLSKRLREILDSEKIDVLISITAGVNTISYFATKNSNIKVIYAEHSNLLNKTYGKKHQFRQWLGAKSSDLVVTLTESDMREFIKKFNIENKCTYIYNWFDDLSKGNYDAESKKIISVGRLEKVKGYDRLLEVAKIFFEKYPDWTWDIYGEGSLKGVLENKIREYYLTDKLFLKGNNPNIVELYKNYSYLVLTSYFEGLPLVLLEAKANMLPVVSFDCPTGPSEIIRNGIDGFLVENGNIEAMVEAMGKLCDSKELRIEFSEKSRNVLENFKKEVILEKWKNVINDL